ncbi:Clp protease N-terminal domain-containing protein [Actinoplanes sp. NPDC089786]|uniref:Clp protease N-terminal domain-containing protein n=1 Tax=Actinoplanes sp. NPDC089786 TaxID=3155185 RepID=UPI00344799A5
MPKINVYLPDDLADAVRDAGLPVSAICQRALELAVRRITTIRQTVLTAISDEELGNQLTSFTARAITVLKLARDAADGQIGTTQLLQGMADEGANMAVAILQSMEISPKRLVEAARQVDEPGSEGFSLPAATALELAVAEATALGHNYVGCEHLLIGLAAETDGGAGHALREAGADAKVLRRSVSAALAGYTQAKNPAAQNSALLMLLRRELAPIVKRVEALEAR